MFIIILTTLGVLGFISWGIITYLGRSQTLSIKSIENPSGDLYLVHITKPKNQIWKAGSYAQFKLPDSSFGPDKSPVKENQASRWLTLASTPDEDEILIVTHNSGSVFKETLTHLPAGSKIEMSCWSHLYLLKTMTKHWFVLPLMSAFLLYVQL